MVSPLAAENPEGKLVVNQTHGHVLRPGCAAVLEEENVVQLQHATAGKVVAGHDELVCIVTAAEHLSVKWRFQHLYKTK